MYCRVLHACCCPIERRLECSCALLAKKTLIFSVTLNDESNAFISTSLSVTRTFFRAFHDTNKSGKYHFCLRF